MSPVTMTLQCSAADATTLPTTAIVVPSPFNFGMGLAGELYRAPAVMKKMMKKPMLKKKLWPRSNPWVMEEGLLKPTLEEEYHHIAAGGALLP
jgi:hypothetical protein